MLTNLLGWQQNRAYFQAPVPKVEISSEPMGKPGEYAVKFSFSPGVWDKNAVRISTSPKRLGRQHESPNDVARPSWRSSLAALFS